MEFRGPQQLLHPPEAARPPETLSYGQQRARRVPWRYAAMCGLLVACTLMSWFVGRTAKAKAQAMLYQQQVARHVESAEIVAYEPTPEAAERLVGGGEHEAIDGIGGARLLDPPAYLAFRRALGDAASELGDRAEEIGAMVFLHELRTDAGTRRIVAVRFLPWAVNAKAGLPTAGLVAHVFEPGGWLGRPKWVATSRAPVLVPQHGVASQPNASSTSVAADRFCDGLADAGSSTLQTVFGRRFDGGRIRWFAGQPDRFDPSHFTLDFELVDGRRGTVDGYLSADGGSIRMTVRSDADVADARFTGVTFDDRS